MKPITRTAADLSLPAISDIIEMALSDHIAFRMILDQHGLTPDQVKALMLTKSVLGSLCLRAVISASGKGQARAYPAHRVFKIHWDSAQADY